MVPRRPDGSIRYAENPPKKYEDIVNPDLNCPDRIALWAALRDVVLFLGSAGRAHFPRRQSAHQAIAILGMADSRGTVAPSRRIIPREAFTRPKVMKALAKLGFSQSYTYFTWRTEKGEIQDYLTELTRYPEREYYRPNFFVNTPDINPVHLQTGEPWIFKSRVALAATLSAATGSTADLS